MQSSSEGEQPTLQQPPHHSATHELRSMIAVVRGHSQLAQRRMANEPHSTSPAALLALSAIERATRVAERSLQALERFNQPSDKDGG
ncbi:MAG: hypothetical protein ACR2OU_20465 [Thermomicrobiales bacterium]